jgi:hypothetical protein
MNPYAFGEYPIHITSEASPESEGYEVDPEEIQTADECGINTWFPAERLDIMQARAAAHGYVLVIEQLPPPVATPDTPIGG